MDKDIKGRLLVVLQLPSVCLWVDFIRSLPGNLKYPADDDVHSLGIPNLSIIVIQSYQNIE